MPRTPQKPKRQALARLVPAVTPARKAAFDILSLISSGKGHSDDLLHSSHTAALSPEDRNLTTAIVMGVLRWQIALDAQLASLLTRPDEKLSQPIAIALRIGAFQLVHMDRIPAHAALSESVELCRTVGQPHAAGMVNAVLRKVATSKPPSKLLFESTAALAQRFAHPLWLVERWASHFGRGAALRVCEYDQQIPQAGELFVSKPGRDGPDVQASDRYDAVPQMDDGSRLVAELAAAAVPDTSTRVRVWDCCAAPGGKTLILAARLPEAEILASDVSARRLQQMQSRFQTGTRPAQVRTAVLDAAALAPSDTLGKFDLILCDVPCSGTGTLARNPEIRHRLRAEDLPRQAQRQRAILTNALQHLAPGGRLVYSTCSLEPEENEAVLDAAIPEDLYRRLPIDLLFTLMVDRGLLPSAARDLLASAVRGDTLRTLPGTHPCDGFFAAVLERL